MDYLAYKTDAEREGEGRREREGGEGEREEGRWKRMCVSCKNSMYSILKETWQKQFSSRINLCILCLVSYIASDRPNQGKFLFVHPNKIFTISI